MNGEKHTCERCEWRTWETLVWFYVVLLAILISPFILYPPNNGSARPTQQQRQHQAHLQTRR